MSQIHFCLVPRPDLRIGGKEACRRLSILECESIQERKPHRETREVIGEDQDTNSDHEGTADHLDRMEVPLESAVESQKLVQTKTGQHERDAKTHRIDGQQKHALSHRLLRAGDREDPGKNRADTGGPSERESQAQHQRAQNPARLFDIMEALVPVQKVDLDDAQQMNAKNNNDEPCDLRQQPHSGR